MHVQAKCRILDPVVVALAVVYFDSFAVITTSIVFAITLKTFTIRSLCDDVADIFHYGSKCDKIPIGILYMKSMYISY